MEHKAPKYKQVEKQLKSLLEESQSPVEKISCPGCGSPVPAEHLHLEKAVAKCGECDGVFSIADILMQLNPVDAEPKEKERLRYMPDGIEYAEFSDGIDFRCQFEDFRSWALTLITSIFGVFCLLASFGMWVGGERVMAIVFSVFGLGSIVAAIGEYQKKKRATHIFVNDKELLIEYPGWDGEYRIDVNRIEKIYVEPDDYTNPNTGEKFKVYNLRLKDDNGQDNKLIKKVRFEKQLLFIKQEVNRYLSALSASDS